MFKKLFLGILSFLLVLYSTTPVFADIIPLISPADIIISEVYPNASGSSEKGSEFIRITNTGSSDVMLAGYSLAVGAAGPVLLPDNIGLQPGASLIVFPLFASLINSGSVVTLHYPDTTILPQSVTYPSAITEAQSWQIVNNEFVKAPLISDDSATLDLELKVEEPEEVPPPEPPLSEEPPAESECTATAIYINEILANPIGADSEGGEYVELYNPTNEPVSLVGCLLTTNKVTNYEVGDATVQAGEYYVVQLADKLLNGGGQITFITHSTEEIIEYPALNDNEAWALVDGSWQVTELATPGAANLPTPPKPPVIQKDETLEPCPEGKIRNPDTNRCKNIVEVASSLLPCAGGEIRNLATNRCRKTASSAASALTPCKAGQERNPATNRCRSVASAATSLVPCQEGYERNPDTNRCRKTTTGSVAGAATFPVTSQAPLHPGILFSLTLLTIAYGIYEYRYDLGNLAHKLRSKHAKNQ